MHKPKGSEPTSERHWPLDSLQAGSGFASGNFATAAANQRVCNQEDELTSCLAQVSLAAQLATGGFKSGGFKSGGHCKGATSGASIICAKLRSRWENILPDRAGKLARQASVWLRPAP